MPENVTTPPQFGRITQLESSSGDNGFSVMEIQSEVGADDTRHSLLSTRLSSGSISPWMERRQCEGNSWPWVGQKPSSAFTRKISL